MTKSEYIEQFDYISNKDFKSALECVRDYGVNIKDWIRDNDWFNPTEMYFYFFNFKEANYEVFKFDF